MNGLRLKNSFFKKIQKIKNKRNSENFQLVEENSFLTRKIFHLNAERKIKNHFLELFIGLIN